MTHQKLTNDRVRKALCPADKQQIFIWDTNVKGLGVRVTPTSRSYIFQDKLGGKSIRIKIGDADTWPVDSADPDHPGARQEAARLKTLIDQGIDPRAEKLRIEAERTAEITEAKRQEVTVGEVWSRYLDDRKQHWSARHYGDHLRLSHLGGRDKKRGKGKTMPAALAALMPIKLSGLTPEVVQKWAAKESKSRPGQARLAFSLIRAFANWCEDDPHYRGLCTPSAFSGRIKKANIPKQLPKQDTLQREQLPAWFASVKKIPNPVMSSYLQVLLLTGARREEILNLQWKDVEFTWASMTIGDKVDVQRTIPLTPYVSYLLKRLPRRNKWVFHSPQAKSGRLQEPRKAHQNALLDAGISHLSIHGLRRSFANLGEWIEAPVGIVYQIQGHKPSATAEKHYRHRPLDLLRKWHTKIEEWILQEARIDMTFLEDDQVLRLVNSKK